MLAVLLPGSFWGRRKQTLDSSGLFFTVEGWHKKKEALIKCLGFFIASEIYRISLLYFCGFHYQNVVSQIMTNDTVSVMKLKCYP